MRGAALVVVSAFACGGPAATPTSPTPPACTALRIPWVMPVVGETLDWESVQTIKGVNSKQEDVTDDVHLVTAEKVRAVGDDNINELEVRFVTATSRSGKPPISALAGRTFRFAQANGKNAFTENGTPVSEELVPALEHYSRNDVGRPLWMLRLLAERTFIVGKETHLTADSAVFQAIPADARIVLRAIDGKRAVFEIEFRFPPKPKALVRGNVVVDIEHGRLVSYEIDARAPEATFHWVEKFRYAQTLPQVATSLCQPTLHVAWIPPRLGESFTIETDVTANVDGTVMGISAVTDQRVLEVADDVATAVELVPKRLVGNGNEITTDATPLVVRSSDGKLEVTHGSETLDAAAAKSVLSKASYLEDVRSRFWATRLVTDRSFQQGVESHFAVERIPTLSPLPADARVTLVTSEPGRAVFKIALDIPVKLAAFSSPVHTQWKGEIELDTVRARTTHIRLEQDTGPGKMRLEWRFRNR